MRMAEAYLFRPFFSQEILDETVHSLEKRRGLSHEIAQDIVDERTREFPESLQEVPPRLHEVMENHPSGRHTLSVAHSSHSELIVTFNQEYFEPEALSVWNVEAIHPDDFLCQICDEVSIRHVFRVVKQLSEDLEEPRLSPLNLLDKLYKRGLPKFASRLATYRFTGDIARISTKALKISDPFNGSTYILKTIDKKLHIETREGRIVFRRLSKHKTEGQVIPKDVLLFREFEDKLKAKVK